MRDRSAINTINESMEAAVVAARLRKARFGIVGPRFAGMLGSDEAAPMKALAVQVVNPKAADLERAVSQVDYQDAAP